MTKKQLVSCSLAIALTGAVALITPAQSKRAATDIQTVDFRNFSYSETVCAPEGGSVTVKNGVFERADEDDRAYFEVRQVLFGDLTGDKRDDAVVITLCNTGGTGQFADGFVYTMRDGKPVLIGTLGVGDRADGGIYDAEIRGGVLYVERFGHGEGAGACCPEYIETYPIRWNGSKLVDSGAVTKRGYDDYLMNDTPAPRRVKFLKGTSAATLVGQSYGGEFAWRAAIDRPERVARVVLMNSSGAPRRADEWLPEEVKLREWRIARFGWLVNSRSRLLSALQPHFQTPVPAERLEEYFLVCENADNWSACVDLARDENGGRVEDLRQLRAPVLLLWGARDIAYPPQRFAAEFEKRLPDVRLVLVPSAGHYPHEEAPADVVRELRAFVAETARRK